MLPLTRVCVPLGLACNLQCRYCYRDMGRIRVPRLTNLMRDYVSQLDPEITEAIIASGGEPLLYRNRIFELFELNPRVHKKIMTNGLLIDSELISYCNRNRVELMLSHDGEMTQYLRGVDVLKNKKIVSLLKDVDILRINCVVTKFNTNCLKIYDYIVNHLGREDFFMTFCPCYQTGNDDDLIDGFNYVEYFSTYKKLFELIPNNWAFNGRKLKSSKGFSLGVNVLPNGSVCSMTSMHIYGTVRDEWQTIRRRIEEMGDYERCFNTPCDDSLRKGCMKELACAHWCKARLGQAAFMNREWE